VDAAAPAAPQQLRALLAATVTALESAAVPDEALGRLREHRRFALNRTRVLEPVGRAWRLGVLLLVRDGSLYATGTVTRAIEPPLGTANKSPEAEERREDRRAAVRGRFAEGEVVNFGFSAVDLDALTEPLAVVDGTVMVRWSPSGLAPLESYLAERLALLLEG
jgi:hypothetical protein